MKKRSGIVEQTVEIAAVVAMVFYAMYLIDHALLAWIRGSFQVIAR